MSSHRTLMFASLAFAMLWAAGMVWWKSPMTTTGVIILMIGGTIAGLIWYGLMRMAMMWSMRRGADMKGMKSR